MIKSIIAFQQVAVESWLTSLPSNLTTAGLLGFFVWYFIDQLKKQAAKHDEALKIIIDRYEAALKLQKEEHREEREEFRNRMDKLIDKVTEVTRTTANAINTSGIIQNDLINKINEHYKKP